MANKGSTRLSRQESDAIINNTNLGLDRITEVINRLTDKTYGCPWDQIQTNQSLAQHTIEEAYEVVDSIENKSANDTCQELGDLLFNILFHTHIASQNGLFSLNQVIDETVKKMVSRHPHVFKDQKIKDISEVNAQWEEIKRAEKNIQGDEKIENELKDIPANIPALNRSIKIQKKVSSIGFDWNESYEIINKIYEEIDEFIEEEGNNNEEGKLDEFGDILFTVVNLGRYAGIDPETALRAANQKFVERFSALEQFLTSKEKSAKNTNKTDLNTIWQKIKHGQ